MKFVERVFMAFVIVLLFAFLISTVFVKAEEGFSVFLPVAFNGEQASPSPTATATVTPTVTPTAIPLPRRETGEGNSLVFSVGEAVYGWKIVLLPSGRTCDGGLCWLPVAPEGGIVTSGVINPWSEEIPPEVTPWVPN